MAKKSTQKKKTTKKTSSILLPVLPLPEVVIFPNSISPLFVVRAQSLAAVEEAAKNDNRLFMVTQKSIEAETPTADDLHEVGTISQILQVQRLPDNSVRIFIEGETICRVEKFYTSKKIIKARVSAIKYSAPTRNKRLTALRRAIVSQFETYAHLTEKIPEDLYLNIKNIEEPLAQCHAITNYSSFKTEDKQAILELPNVVEKLLYISRVFTVENELLAMEGNIISQVKSQIGRNQKEYFLNEQLKIIENELGLHGEEDIELEQLQTAVEESKMSAEAREKAQSELNRLARMAPMSPESTVSRTYLECLLDYPWQEYTQDNLDLRRAMKFLNEDHFGLEPIKERIVEFLAVLRLLSEDKMRGPILCLVGPPGVGKTSLARSIARTMDRKFARFSLGGVRDEAEIRGHRRTYIGALPGKIVQLMKKSGSSNPVILLDEIDKMNADFRGDPASALLEVLDPEQNKNFNDHYMEVDLDLSKTLFVTTANTTDGIPWALQDRMEILRLPGYTRGEKLEIACKFLVPRQLEAHGLTRKQLNITREAIEFVIDFYTREAGVRNVDRKIAALCRKVARKLAGRKSKTVIRITSKEARKFLGPLRYTDPEHQLQKPLVGTTMGLAWTEVGGELLPVEASVMVGKGNLQLTGTLGEVMQESAQAGLSYIRVHAKQLKIAEDFYEKQDIHVHLPEGAIPKDGPSAGVTMITSMVSALSGRAVRQDIAMTGETTLSGKVLRIGGLKEKVIAAHRARIRHILIPWDNKEDLQEIASHIRKDIKFQAVKNISQVLRIALVDKDSPIAAKKKRSAKRKTATKSRRARV